MKQILIVDDEIMIADGLQDMLSEAMKGKAGVKVCYSAAEALRIIRNESIHVLMTDINMPNVTGLELHREVLSLQPECRVIYLTGYSEFEYARQAIDMHAFAYVLKGEGDDMIIQTVLRALEDNQEPPKEPEKEAEPESSGLPWIPDLLQYIGSHIDQNLSLQSLAEYLHFHPVYLSRAFKDSTGTTLGDYIGSVRLDRAKALLSGSQMTLEQIACKTGFSTTNYFCRWFHKETHMTPKAYRKQER